MVTIFFLNYQNNVNGPDKANEKTKNDINFFKKEKYIYKFRFFFKKIKIKWFPWFFIYFVVIFYFVIFFKKN